MASFLCLFSASGILLYYHEAQKEPTILNFMPGVPQQPSKPPVPKGSNVPQGAWTLKTKPTNLHSTPRCAKYSQLKLGYPEFKLLLVIWVSVKSMVPFGILSIMRHLIIILTTTLIPKFKRASGQDLEFW